MSITEGGRDALACSDGEERSGVIGAGVGEASCACSNRGTALRLALLVTGTGQGGSRASFCISRAARRRELSSSSVFGDVSELNDAEAERVCSRLGVGDDLFKWGPSSSSHPVLPDTPRPFPLLDDHSCGSIHGLSARTNDGVRISSSKDDVGEGRGVVFESFNRLLRCSDSPKM